MKYVTILGDGMSDRPFPALGDHTPLELATKPNMDRAAAEGRLFLVKNVPDGMPPGSDTANMSAMGFDPAQSYSGRSPLEAVSMGIEMSDNDLSFRTNLVTLEGEGPLSEGRMIDYSSGEITSAESKILIEMLNDELKTDDRAIYPGKSYRHCMIWKGGPRGNDLTPPHDITGRDLADYLPKGPGAEVLLDIMEKSRILLKDHPVNLKRRAEGKNEATCLWPWGEGTRPSLPGLSDIYGVKGAVISAVDLVQGIGICCGMDVILVDGATGNLETNFPGKGEACIKALEDGNDYVYVHIEAPDECGHQGDYEGKVRSIELIDRHILGPVWDYLEENRRRTGEPYRIMVMPDHPTPLAIRTHSSDPVPCALYDSEKAADRAVDNSSASGNGSSAEVTGSTVAARYTEAAAQEASGGKTVRGHRLFAHFIDDTVDPFED